MPGFLVRELNRPSRSRPRSFSLLEATSTNLSVTRLGVAVFLGGEGSAEKVFACARELVGAIRQEIESEGWPLALGVGISSRSRGGRFDRLRHAPRFYRHRFIPVNLAFRVSVIGPRNGKS